MAIGAFAVASRALGPSPPLFPVDGTPASQYLDYALQVIEVVVGGCRRL